MVVHHSDNAVIASTPHAIKPRMTAPRVAHCVRSISARSTGPILARRNTTPAGQASIRDSWFTV